MSRFGRRALLAALVLALAACGGSSSKSNAGSGNPAANELQATVASFDITPGGARRFLVGLQTGDARFIGFGTVQVRVHPAHVSAAAGEVHEATFLPVPATQVPDPLPSKPTLIDPARGRGVYSTNVAFAQPGVWTAEVDADVDGIGRVHASTDFQVASKHEAIAVGDRAPASKNYTIANHGDAPITAVDSRAQGSDVPNPELHRTTIAAALAAHKPIVAVFSTPVYCQSRFCGPITEMVAGVAKTNANKAAFIHVEIFKNFQNSEVNDAALQWLQRVPGGDIHEPWLFLVGSDGKVKARFDNVVTKDELEQALTSL